MEAENHNFDKTNNTDGKVLVWHGKPESRTL